MFLFVRLENKFSDLFGDIVVVATLIDDQFSPSKLGVSRGTSY